MPTMTMATNAAVTPVTNVSETNINSTQEGSQSSAPMTKERPASNISLESSKVSSIYLAKQLCFN